MNICNTIGLAFNWANSVYLPPPATLSAGGGEGGGVEPPTKFLKKERGLTRSQFLEGVPEKREVAFFRGLQLLHKK